MIDYKEEFAKKYHVSDAPSNYSSIDFESLDKATDCARARSFRNAEPIGIWVLQYIAEAPEKINDVKIIEA